MADVTLNPGQFDMIMRRGSSFGPITLVLRDSVGALINLTGKNAIWEARPEAGSPNALDLEPGIATPASGQVIITKTADDVLRDFPAGRYDHSLTIQDAGTPADITPPVVRGLLTVEDQPARP